MLAFFDTSAVVPLLLREPHSQSAGKIWEETSDRYAWQWLRVETEAALMRRTAPPGAWQQWRIIETAVHWLEPEQGWMEHLRSFNRGVGLRAADAGHLYVFEQSLRGMPALQLITYDKEMRGAATKRGLPCLPRRVE